MADHKAKLQFECEKRNEPSGGRTTIASLFHGSLVIFCNSKCISFLSLYDHDFSLCTFLFCPKGGELDAWSVVAARPLVGSRVRQNPKNSVHPTMVGRPTGATSGYSNTTVNFQ